MKKKTLYVWVVPNMGYGGNIASFLDEIVPGSDHTVMLWDTINSLNDFELQDRLLKKHYCAKEQGYNIVVREGLDYPYDDIAEYLRRRNTVSYLKLKKG